MGHLKLTFKRFSYFLYQWNKLVDIPLILTVDYKYVYVSELNTGNVWMYCKPDYIEKLRDCLFWIRTEQRYQRFGSDIKYTQYFKDKIKNKEQLPYNYNQTIKLWKEEEKLKKLGLL